MNDNIERWHMLFYGEVQFVGFRYTARQIANKLGLTGFVRNLDNGSVEAEVQGRPSLLRAFLLRLKSQPHIRVTRYSIEKINPDPTEKRFSVRSGEFET